MKTFIIASRVEPNEEGHPRDHDNWIEGAYCCFSRRLGVFSVEVPPLVTFAAWAGTDLMRLPKGSGVVLPIDGFYADRESAEEALPEIEEDEAWVSDMPLHILDAGYPGEGSDG